MMGKAWTFVNVLFLSFETPMYHYPYGDLMRRRDEIRL